MAIINKTGIGEGNLIQAEHITRIIDALTSVSTDTVSATGSFTGSFVGNGSGLTGIVSSTATSASYAATASFLTGTIESASFASTASFSSTSLVATTASFSSTASFVNILNQSVTISGSTSISGSVTQTAGNATFLDDVFIGGTKHWPEQTVTTTDETKTIIWTDTISTNTGAWIDATIIGKSGSATPQFITGDLKAGFRRGTIVPSQMGEITSSFNNFATQVSYGAEAGPSGGIIRIWVSGSAASTIDWVAAVKIHTNP
jgi:hypothetical protein